MADVVSAQRELAGSNSRQFGSGPTAGFGSSTHQGMQASVAGNQNGSGSDTRGFGSGPTRRIRPMSAERSRPGAGRSDFGTVAAQRPSWQQAPTVTTGTDGVERIHVRPTSAPPERPNPRNQHATLPYSDNFLERTGESVDLALARFQVMSLPEKGKLRMQLQSLLTAEAKKRRSERADRLLLTTRGKYGDWRASRARDLACLVQALAEGGRHAEMTRVLSDPQFLQRRLRLGTLPELLEDFDICEKALEDLIASEPIHKRSAESSAALSRRMYLSSLRHYLKGHAKKMHGHDSIKFFSALAKSQFASIVHPLITSLMAFVSTHEAFFSARMRSNNRPVELWLPLQESANVMLLQADPSSAQSLIKELLVAVSVSPSRLSVRFEACDDDSQPFAGYAVVAVSTLIEATGLWSLRIAEALRQYVMLPWSELCQGAWGKILDLAAIREYLEVVDSDTAKQDVAMAMEVRERLQLAQDSGLVECLDHSAAQRIRSMWRYAQEVLTLNAAAAGRERTSKKGPDTDVFGYELSVNALQGFAAPGTCVLKDLGSSIADAAGVRVEEVSVQVLGGGAGPASAIRLLVLLPVKDLHRPAKIHKGWQSRFQVTEGPHPMRRTVWWWFCRPLSHDLRDAELSTIINKSINLKGHGSASVQVQLSQLRKWVRVELPTEVPVAENGVVFMEALKDELFERQGQILDAQPAINELVVASQASGAERDDWEVSPDSMEWFAGEAVEQERVLEHHLLHFSRKESRERLLIQLQALCHYHHQGHSLEEASPGARVVVVEGAGGSGRSALVCRLAKDLALLGKMGVVVGIRRPGQALEALMEHVAMDLGLQMCGRAFLDGDRAAIAAGHLCWQEDGQPAPAVVMLDGLSDEEQQIALAALLGDDLNPTESERSADSKSRRRVRGWRQRLRLALKGVQGGLTCVLTTDRAEATCGAASGLVAPESVSVLQLEAMSLAEQRTLLRSHAQGIGDGAVGGGASHALKALEEVITVHARLGALPGAKAVGELSPLSPMFLACATRYVLGSEQSRVVDDGFPRGVTDLMGRLLQQQERIYGSEAVIAAVEPFLWEGEGLPVDTVASGVPARLRSAVLGVVKGLRCLLYPPYLSKGKMAEATDARYAPLNASARSLLQQYVRQTARKNEEGSSDSLTALGLRSLDAVEDFLRRSAGSANAHAAVAPLPSPGQLSVDRVQCRSVLVSWTIRELPSKAGRLHLWYEVEARKLHSKEEKEASMGVMRVEASSGRLMGGGEWVRLEAWFADKLLPSHAYLLQVRACREGQAGPWRSTTCHTPPVPPKPEIQLSDVRSSSVLVEWSLPGAEQTQVDKFVLEKHSPGSDQWVLAYEGTERSFTLAGLHNAQRYRLRLCSKINGDSSSWDQKAVYTAVPRKRLIMGAARYLIGILRSFGGKREDGVNELRDVTDRGLHFFEKEGDPHGSGTWVGASDRALSTLLLKLVDGSRWSTLQGLICNPMFMTRLVRARSNVNHELTLHGLNRSIEELGVDFMLYRVFEPALLRMGQESADGTQAPQRRAIGAIMEQLKTHRKALEEGQKFAAVLADNLQGLAMYSIGSGRDTNQLQDELDPAARVVGAGRDILDKLLDNAGEVVNKVQDHRWTEDDGELMVRTGKLLQDLRAARVAGLARLCEARDGKVHDESLDARIAALEEYLATEGEKGMERVAERMLSGVRVDAQSVVDIARDLSTLLEMQSLNRAGPGSKALLRLQLAVPFYNDGRGTDEWTEKMAGMRSRLLSALTAYAGRVLGVRGVCMRLEHEANVALDMEVAEGVANGIQEREETLMAALDGMVKTAEFCTDSRARFLIIGMACSVQSAVVPKAMFRDSLRKDVADTVGIPMDMVRVMKVTPRRTFVVVEIDTGLQNNSLVSINREEIGRKMARVTGQWLQENLTTKDIVLVAVVDGSVPPLLPGERTTIKVFNSSTFSDMHAERDFLNNFVFPAIRCSCVKRRIDFSWIDFRWGGVTSKESQEGLGVVKCLKKIDECVLRLPHGINVPVVIGMLGQRAGWIPEEGSKDRKQAETHFKWLQADKYKGYSVTGMEMEHAFFRLPYASESFFFIRDHAFMHQRDALQQVPESAQLVFSESRKEAKQFAKLLRGQASDKAEGRCFHYKPVWQSPPYHFSTEITLDKIQDLKAELQTSGKRTIAKVFELIRWWLLLKEQFELESKLQPSDSANNEDGPEAELSPLQQQLRDAVNDPFIEELKAEVTDPPTHGNQNVAAHGVRFKLPRLGLQVMRALQSMFDAYYPVLATIQFKHGHMSDRNAQEAVMEEFASSFCDGTREKALDELDAAMFGEEGQEGVCTVLAVEGLSNSGKTATLARFVFTKSYKTHHETPSTPDNAKSIKLQTMSLRRRRSSVEAVKGWIFAYFFCPLDSNLDRVLSYLAIEIAVQHRGSKALQDAGLPGDDSAKGRFEHALGAALMQHRVLLVVDGLGGRELDRLVRTTLGVYDKAKKDNPGVVCRCLFSAALNEMAGWQHLRPDLKRMTVEPLEEQERRDMCRFWMARFGKENLSDSQLDIAIKKKDSTSPLYLVLFCAEASLLSLYERVDYELEHMQGTVEEIWIHRTLPRLENCYGKEIVKQMMLQLLAYPQGLRLSDLKLLMQDHPAFKNNSGTSTAVLVEQVADALLLFMRPGHSGEPDSVLCFNSNTITSSTKRRYAPVAAKHEEQLRDAVLSKMAENMFSHHRTAVIECMPAKPIDKAPPQPEPVVEVDNLEFLWRFDVQGQRDLVVDKDNVQVRSVSSKDSTTSALVTPCIHKDRNSYFEVVLENGGLPKECKVRVGVLIWNDQSSSRVPKRMAASSHKLGWLFDCNNGNMQHHSAGNAFVNVQCNKGDRVGLNVIPAAGDVRVYVNSKFIGQLPLSVHDRRLFKSNDARFVVDLGRKDAAVVIARLDPAFAPEEPPPDAPKQGV